MEREILLIELIDLVLTLFLLATLWSIKDELRKL